MERIMMNEVYTREQAKASDKKLYDLMLATARAESVVRSRLTSVHHTANDSYRRRYDSRSGWKLTDQEAVDKLVAMAADEDLIGYRRDEARKDLDNLREAQDARDAADAAVRAQEKEWSQHGMWPRYAIVPGGHIHKEMGCFTLRYDTDVRWAYFVSGDSVDEAIEVYGTALCTHCYPDAPVDKTDSTIAVDAEGNPLTKAQAEAAKAARAAEKQAKHDAKNAAAVLHPDTGKVLYKTERAAKNEVLGHAYDALLYEMDHPSMPKWHAHAMVTIDALVAKGVIDREEFVAEVAMKAAKKRVKELKGWRDHWQVKQMAAQGIPIETPAYDGKTWQELAPLIEAWLAN